MLRVHSKDPGLVDVGFDATGEQIFEYNGLPFTGIMEYYFWDTPQMLSAEIEYEDGYKYGIHRRYHHNGQLKDEFTWKHGGFDGRYREWDITGNLTYDKMWANGEEQP
jgi:antitoxin component YwqK of YwqJK toxin-antitoxin module